MSFTWSSIAAKERPLSQSLDTTAAAGPLLIDLETVGVGLVVYDFAPLHVEAVRYGRPSGAFSELCGVYESYTGIRPADDGASFDAAVALYEMWAALWAGEAALRDPAVRRLSRFVPDAELIDDHVRRD